MPGKLPRLEARRFDDAARGDLGAERGVRHRDKGFGWPSARPVAANKVRRSLVTGLAPHFEGGTA